MKVKLHTGEWKERCSHLVCRRCYRCLVKDAGGREEVKETKSEIRALYGAEVLFYSFYFGEGRMPA